MSTHLEQRIKLLEHQMQTALTAVSNDNASIMRLLEQTMQAISTLNNRLVEIEKEVFNGGKVSDSNEEGVSQAVAPGTES